MKVITDFFSPPNTKNESKLKQAVKRRRIMDCDDNAVDDEEEEGGEDVNYEMRKIKIRLADPNVPDSYVCEIYDTSVEDLSQEEDTIKPEKPITVNAFDLLMCHKESHVISKRSRKVRKKKIIEKFDSDSSSDDALLSNVKKQKPQLKSETAKIVASESTLTSRRRSGRCLKSSKDDILPKQRQSGRIRKPSILALQISQGDDSDASLEEDDKILEIVSEDNLPTSRVRKPIIIGLEIALQNEIEASPEKEVINSEIQSIENVVTTQRHSGRIRRPNIFLLQNAHDDETPEKDAESHEDVSNQILPTTQRQSGRVRKPSAVALPNAQADGSEATPEKEIRNFESVANETAPTSRQRRKPSIVAVENADEDINETTPVMAVGGVEVTANGFFSAAKRRNRNLKMVAKQVTDESDCDVAQQNDVEETTPVKVVGGLEVVANDPFSAAKRRNRKPKIVTDESDCDGAQQNDVEETTPVKAVGGLEVVANDPFSAAKRRNRKPKIVTDESDCDGAQPNDVKETTAFKVVGGLEVVANDPSLAAKRRNRKPKMVANQVTDESDCDMAQQNDIEEGEIVSSDWFHPTRRQSGRCQKQKVVAPQIINDNDITMTPEKTVESLEVVSNDNLPMPKLQSGKSPKSNYVALQTDSEATPEKVVPSPSRNLSATRRQSSRSRKLKVVAPQYVDETDSEATPEKNSGRENIIQDSEVTPVKDVGRNCDLPAVRRKSERSPKLSNVNPQIIDEKKSDEDKVGSREVVNSGYLPTVRRRSGRSPKANQEPPRTIEGSDSEATPEKVIRRRSTTNRKSGRRQKQKTIDPGFIDQSDSETTPVKEIKKRKSAKRPEKESIEGSSSIMDYFKRAKSTNNQESVEKESSFESSPTRRKKTKTGKEVEENSCAILEDEVLVLEEAPEIAESEANEGSCSIKNYFKPSVGKRAKNTGVKDTVVTESSLDSSLDRRKRTKVLKKTKSDTIPKKDQETKPIRRCSRTRNSKEAEKKEILEKQSSDEGKATLVAVEPREKMSVCKVVLEVMKVNPSVVCSSSSKSKQRTQGSLTSPCKVVLEGINVSSIVESPKKSSLKKSANEDCVIISEKPLAPLFMKKQKVSPPDPEVLKARKKFLMSGMPAANKDHVGKARDSSDVSYFPKVVHVEQRGSEEIWSRRCVNLSLLSVKPYEPPPLLFRREIVSETCAEKNTAGTARKVPKINEKVLDKLKSIYKNVCIEKLYKSLKSRRDKYIQSKGSIGEVIPPMWTKKYRPGSEGILSNDKTVSSMRKWLISWQSYGEELKNGSAPPRKRTDSSDDFITSDEEDGPKAPVPACLLHGPTSSGKTALVNALAKDLDLNVLEINASSKRTGKRILTELQEATQSHTVLQETGGKSSMASQGKDTMSVIVVEDADIVYEDQDDGFVSALSTLVATTKRPVLLLTSDPTVRHLEKFRTSHTLQLEMIRPHPTAACAFLEIIALLEGSSPPRPSLLKLLGRNDMDLRRSILELQFWLLMAEKDVQTWSTVQITPTRVWWNSHELLFEAPLRHLVATEVPQPNKSPNPESEVASNDNNNSEIGQVSANKKFERIQDFVRFFENVSYADICSKKEISMDELSCSQAQVRDTLSLEQDFRCINWKIRELGNEIEEEILSGALARFSCQRELKQPSIPYQEQRWLRKRRKAMDEILEVLPCRSSGRSTYTDYLPTLRGICRSEEERGSLNTKRRNRFYHYVQTLGGKPTETNLSLNCSIFKS